MSDFTQTGQMAARNPVRAGGGLLLSLLRLLTDTLIDKETVRSGRLAKQLKDFVHGGHSLFLTRQGMYFGSSLLAAYYYSPKVALLCFALSQFAEFLDNMVSAGVIRWNGEGPAKAIRFRNQLLITSTLSAIVVGTFAVLVAQIEGPTWHFTPLVFLLSAGLFAAVNNHQIPMVLYSRLVVYGAVFLYIPLKDIWDMSPPLSSELWLQFFTVIFVLFFVINCSIIFLRLYRTNLDRLDELRIERDRAHTAYEVKSQFVAVVSHEFRTPLHSIMGSLNLLDTGKLEQYPDRSRKMVTIAFKNSKRLSNLIDDLLDLQKLEAEQMNYDFAPTELCDIVYDAIESVQGVSERNEVDLVFVNPGVRLIACADHSKIQQVLTNLMSNALKFSEKGSSIEIRLFADGDRVGVEVKDFGIGIPEGSRAVVFGKFSQIDSSDERNHAGSGLGLSIAEQIITAHDGVIDYVSELGQGATFRIELPAHID
jgi:signal transduction histidine kinase